MRWDVYEVSLELIAGLREPVTLLRSRDPELGSQLRRAASSVPLNLREGRRRAGRDRLHHYRIAAGSADEARAALQVAVAWGSLDQGDVAISLGLLDRLLAMLYRMTR